MTKSLSLDAIASEQSPALHLRTRALAAQVVDQAMCLSITQGAFSALEKLITPEYLEDLQESLDVPRWELGALLNIVNADLKRQIHGLTDAATALSDLTAVDANPNPGLDATK